MALDPDFVRKIQERKAAREALEQKYGNSTPSKGVASASGKTSSSPKSPRKKAGPVYRSVSMLSGESVIIDGEDARKRAEKAQYKG